MALGRSCKMLRRVLGRKRQIAVGPSGADAALQALIHRQTRDAVVEAMRIVLQAAAQKKIDRVPAEVWSVLQLRISESGDADAMCLLWKNKMYEWLWTSNADSDALPGWQIASAKDRTSWDPSKSPSKSALRTAGSTTYDQDDGHSFRSRELACHRDGSVLQQFARSAWMSGDTLSLGRLPALARVDVASTPRAASSSASSTDRSERDDDETTQGDSRWHVLLEC